MRTEHLVWLKEPQTQLVLLHELSVLLRSAEWVRIPGRLRGQANASLLAVLLLLRTYLLPLMMGNWDWQNS